ncbi:DsbA family protein, partial [Patescibacteria group bacterium]|nr:DsbA family protein [Patescibacteria group bacterium]
MNQEFTEEKNSSSEKATITIPSVSISLPRISTTGVLMFFLIIASFFLGSFVAKQQIKQDEKSGIIQANNQVIPQPLPSIGVIGTQQQVGQAVVPGKKVEVDSGHLEIKGDKNAKVTVVEFADFRCPFCERFFTDVEPQLIKDYVNTGKVKLAYRHFAFLGPASVVAANASECANEQNKFWDMHDYLFENQPSESDTSLYTTDKLTSIAGSLGMS